MFEVVQFAGRAVLGVPLLVAAIVTMFDFGGSRRALQAFGVSPHLAAPTALLLALGELTLGAVLVPVPAVWWQTPIWLGVLGFVIMGLLLGAFGTIGFSAQRVAQRVPLRVIRTLRADLRRAA